MIIIEFLLDSSYFLFKHRICTHTAAIHRPTPSTCLCSSLPGTPINVQYSDSTEHALPTQNSVSLASLDRSHVLSGLLYIFTKPL